MFKALAIAGAVASTVALAAPAQAAVVFTTTWEADQVPGGPTPGNYIIYSITTLYYIGYLLLIAYFVYAIKHYVHNNYYKYSCGKCGAKMKRKGICKKCGTINE